MAMDYTTQGSKHQIPNNQPRTQPHRPPEHRLCDTALLRRALQLLVALPDVRLRGGHVCGELADEVFLGGEVRDEGLLEGGDLEEGFFGISIVICTLVLLLSSGLVSLQEK